MKGSFLVLECMVTLDWRASLEYLYRHLYGHWFFKFLIILAQLLGRLGLPTGHPEKVERSISFYFPHRVFTHRTNSRLVKLFLFSFLINSVLTSPWENETINFWEKVPRTLPIRKESTSKSANSEQGLDGGQDRNDFARITSSDKMR